MIQNCWSRRRNNNLGRSRRKSDKIRNERVRDSAVSRTSNGVDTTSFDLAATARLCHTHCVRKDDGLHHRWRVSLNIGPYATRCGRGQRHCDRQQQQRIYTSRHSHLCNIAAEQWPYYPIDARFGTDRPDAVDRSRALQSRGRSHDCRRIGDYGDTQPKLIAA